MLQWRNRQTRLTQNQVPVRECRFKSYLKHYHQNTLLIIFIKNKTMSIRNNMVNHSYPHDCEVGIEKTAVTYIQKSDTWDDTETPFQKMTLETIPVDFNEEENTDSFIRVKVGPIDFEAEPDICDHWSVVGLEDLVNIFNDFMRRSGTYVRYELKKIIQKPDGTITKEEVFK